MIKKSLILFLTIVLFQQYSFAQEIGISSFYQGDLLFDSRFGLSLNYNQKINNIFSISFEYGNQYINQTYNTGGLDYSSKVEAKDYLNNLSINPLISVFNGKKIEIQVGSKHSLFLLVGKENVNATEYIQTSDTTFSYFRKNYIRYPLKTYYSYSNELRFKIKDIFIHNISINIDLSAGFIFNGSRPSGCLIMPTDIFAPYGRIGLGVSYNFNK